MRNWDWDTIATATSFILPLLVAFLGLLTYEIYSENILVENNIEKEKLQNKKKQKKIQFKILLFGTFLLSLFGCLAQIAASHQRHAMEAYEKTYNTDIAQKYEDKFDGDFMVKQRIRASKALLEYLSSTNKSWDSLTNGTGGLDYVLGFFDEIGYDEAHGKISADVVDEYFYADILAYYQGGKEYIAYSQKTDSTDDFEYVKPLLDAVTEVESKKTGESASAQVWNKKDLSDYLEDEIDLKKDK
jgi:ribosomal protein S17E